MNAMSNKLVASEDDSIDDDDFGLDMSLFGEERVNHGGPNAPPVAWDCPGRSDISPIMLKVSDSSSTSLMAHHVWQSSMTLSAVLANNELSIAGVKIEPETTVVELGAGAALPSIVCDLALKAKAVVATDYPDPNVLKAMQENAIRNKCSERLKVMGYDWGTDTSPILEVTKGYPDIILAADTLWISKYHPAHLQAVRDLAGPSTLVVFAFMHHDHDGSTAGSFLKSLSQNGFTLLFEESRDWRSGNKTATERSRLDYGDVIIKVFKRNV